MWAIVHEGNKGPNRKSQMKITLFWATVPRLRHCTPPHWASQPATPCTTLLHTQKRTHTHIHTCTHARTHAHTHTQECCTDAHYCSSKIIQRMKWCSTLKQLAATTKIMLLCTWLCGSEGWKDYPKQRQTVWRLLSSQDLKRGMCCVQILTGDKVWQVCRKKKIYQSS